MKKLLKLLLLATLVLQCSTTSSLQQIPTIQTERRIYSATINSVYDGDTVTGIIDVGFGVLVKTKMRLEGIDTWEVRGVERPQGLIARDYLRSLILEKEIKIECSWPEEYGKYGRLLTTIWLDTINVNKLLVVEGHGEFVEY